MDFSSDFVRREAKESQREHEAVMGRMRELVARLFGGDSTEPQASKADFVLNGLNRRRFLRVGGVTVATAALFAACGTDEDAGDASAAGGTPPTSAPSQSDLLMLRTASSIEQLAVRVYQTVTDSGLVRTPAVGDAVKLFQGQHAEHSKLFESATTKAGGKAFTDPNPVLLQSLDPAIKALADETGVVRLALDLERAAAATYQASVGKFRDRELNSAVMSVGGVEARHVAVFLSVLRQPPVGAAFQTTEAAVPAGTGV